MLYNYKPTINSLKHLVICFFLNNNITYSQCCVSPSPTVITYNICTSSLPYTQDIIVSSTCRRSYCPNFDPTCGECGISWCGPSGGMIVENLCSNPLPSASITFTSYGTFTVFENYLFFDHCGTDCIEFVFNVNPPPAVSISLGGCDDLLIRFHENPEKDWIKQKSPQLKIKFNNSYWGAYFLISKKHSAKSTF